MGAKEGRVEVDPRDRQSFVWTGGYETKDIPKRAGFRWDPDRRVWRTSNPEVARRVPREFWGESFVRYLEEMENRISRVELKVPPGLSLYPYQEEGAKRVLLSGGIILADEMGLGKTVQVLVALASDPEANRVLVVCPSTMKLSWVSEARRWLLPIKPDLDIVVLSGTQEEEEVAKRLAGDRVFAVVNYDIVAYWPSIRARAWDALVLDEAHYVKNPKAKRTTALFGSMVKNPVRAKKKVALTGTPIVNRPIEAWPVLAWIRPEEFGSYWGYAKRYCDAHHNGFGWDVRGASNIEELSSRLRPILLRRKKEEVLRDLPPKVRQVLEVPPNGAQKLLSEEADLVSMLRQELLAARREVEVARVGGSDQDLSRAMERVRRVVRMALSQISVMRHKLALSKVPYALEHIEDILSNKEKVVVWVHHRDVAQALLDGLRDYNPVSILGGMSSEERDLAVRRFQSDPSVRVAVCSLGAAAEGITLTASDTAVFVELDWRPSKIVQAEDRIHRIGQDNAVLIQYLVYPGSVDSMLASAISSKIKTISRIVDGEGARNGGEDEEGSLMESILLGQTTGI